MEINRDYSGTYLGKYYLTKKLGNGTFGAVYSAYDNILQVNKALKILNVNNPNEAYKLFSEAAIPFKCQHPNIIKINNGELINVNNELIFVIDMELATGPSVAECLKNSFISVSKSLNIIKSILFAVEYSHIQGVIHRDIKPANILLDNGTPKLADFGLSMTLGNSFVPERWYESHAAPEIFANCPGATIATDIFSLGMTLYRIVNNISGWGSFLKSQFVNPSALIYSGKLIDYLPFSPYVPEQIISIVKKACNINPARRYRTASEMRNSIERLHCNYDWNPINYYYWYAQPSSDCYLEIKLEHNQYGYEVIVTRNNIKSSLKSKQFYDMDSATNYFFNYIKSTTLK